MTSETKPGHVCKPCASLYYCPASGRTESDCHGGFDVCCDRPDLHRLATTAEILGHADDGKWHDVSDNTEGRVFTGLDGLADVGPGTPWTRHPDYGDPNIDPITGAPLMPVIPNPAARRHALAFNAVGPAVNEAGCWLPLSARRAVADAVLEAVGDPAERCGDLDQLYGDLDWTREQLLAAQQEATGAVTRAKQAEAGLAEERALSAALDRVRAVLGRLDEFADLTASVPDRSLYRGIAADLRAALTEPEEPRP
ncbi:hypothetical protein AB0F20_05625 [Streptomyces goshikiensis]|uniref:hypothetical protein n=1 Tax=Streptomyces goshikiensis TaxID=1942 RepID=UPI0033E8C6DF